MAACIRGMRLTSCFDRFSPEGHAVKFGREERRSRVSRRPFLTTHVCVSACACVCVCIRSVSVSQLLTQFQISRPSRARNISPLWESAPRLVPRMLPFRRLRTIVRSYLPTMEAIDRLDCHRMHAKHARILLFRGISITFLRGLSTNVFIYKDIDR